MVGAVKSARPLISDALGVTTLTCDPGFSAFGWGLVRFDKSSRQHAVLAAGCVRTKKSAKKHGVLATEDNFARLREIAQELREQCAPHAVRLITFEAFSMPMRAGKSAIVKMAYPYGALAMLASLWDIPVVSPTPQQVKKALTGKLSASKEQVEEAVRARMATHAEWDGSAEPDLGDLAGSYHNHVWDALAAYVAAQQSDVARALFA